MKRKQLITVCLFLTIAVILLHACKKQEQTTAVIDISVFKNIVKTWQQQFMKDASAKTKKNADSILTHLDYSSAAKIQLADTATLFIVKIDQQQPNTNIKYLGISFSHEAYKLDGIYEAKSIEQIDGFFKTHKLVAKDSIIVWGVNGEPIKGWDATAGNRMLYRKGKGVTKSGLVTSAAKSVTDNGNRKLDFVRAPDPGEEDVCIDWSWTYYDANTLEYLYEVYIGSTGNCGGTGGVIYTEEQLACINQMNQAISNFDEETENDGVTSGVNISIGDTGAEIYDPQSGVIAKPWDKDWICFTGALHIWTLTAHESGSKRKVSDNVWCFQKIQHDGITMNGSYPYGLTIAFTQGTPVWSETSEMISAYSFYAMGLQLKFNVTYSINTNCGLVARVASVIRPPVSKDYTAKAFFQL